MDESPAGVSCLIQVGRIALLAFIKVEFWLRLVSLIFVAIEKKGEKKTLESCVDNRDGPSGWLSVQAIENQLLISTIRIQYPKEAMLCLYVPYQVILILGC